MSVSSGLRKSFLWLILVILLLWAMNGQAQYPPRRMALSPDGSMVAVTGRYYTVNMTAHYPIDILDTNIGTTIMTLDDPEIGVINGLDWSPDSTHLISGSGAARLDLWDIASGTQSTLVAAGMIPAEETSWSPAGDMILEIVGNIIYLFDPSTGDRIPNFGNLRFPRTITAAWNADGSRLAAIGGAYTIRVWDTTIANFPTIAEFAGEPISTLAWSPNGNLLAGGGTGNVTVYDTSNWQVAYTLTLDVADGLDDIAWSSDGMYLAGSTSNGIYVWDIQAGQIIETYPIDADAFDVEWHPYNLTLFYSGGPEGVPYINGRLLGSPTADAGPDQTLPDTDSSGSEPVMLDGSASTDPDGTIVSYAWTENDVEIATGPTPFVDLAVGAHTIILTVTDDDGITANDEVIITVEP